MLMAQHLDEPRPSLRRSMLTALTRVGDIMISAGLIAVSAPLMAMAMVLLKSDGGRALIPVRRYAVPGQEARHWRFRTTGTPHRARFRLVHEWGGWRYRRIHSNPTIATVTGALLARSGLDGLPKLFAVLSGDLSILGSGRDGS